MHERQDFNSNHAHSASEVSTRVLAVSALVLVLALLLIGFVRYICVLRETIPYPYELDYGEGIVWEQMRLIVAGRGYTPINTFPSIVFMYPPLYHLLSAALSNVTGMDQLAAGRLLSAISTVGAGGMIGLIVTRLTKQDGGGNLSWICGLIGGLLIFSMMPVLHWSRFMRIDMLAIFFSISGLYFGIRALREPKAIHIAALFFVAAVFTRQTSLPAPAAVFTTLLFVRTRTAFSGIATCMISGFALVGFAEWQTNGEFIRQIIFYNVNRTQMGRLEWVLTMFSQHVAFISVAIFAIGLRTHRCWKKYRTCIDFADFRRVLAGNESDSQFLMVSMYFVMATPMLLAIVKVGSSYNYFLEWLCAVTLLVGLAMREPVLYLTSKNGNGTRSLLAIALPLLVAFQAFVLPDVPIDSWRTNAARRVELNQLFQMVRSARKPISSDEMVMLVRAGKTLPWEPAMYSELGTIGVWDQKPFVRKIRNGDFSFFITAYDGKGAIFGGCYNQAVADAIAVAYPFKRKLGGYTVRLPANSSGF
jgi:hypothetical protein